MNKRNNKSLEPGIGEGEENVQGNEGPILPEIDKVGENQRDSTENHVTDEKGVQTQTINGCSVHETGEHFDNRIHDHKQGDVGSILHLAVVHAVHKNGLKPKTQEEGNEESHLGGNHHL